MSLTPGTRLGAYEIVAKLGAGGMGEVYRARDTRLGRDVALKILADSIDDAPTPSALKSDRLARFEREAHAVAALNHPNIVTIHSVEAIDGTHFLTMELVDGKPLSGLIAPGGLPLDRFLRIAIPLADAVGAAHQRGVTHRDIKPSNVMLTADGRVKILDFGLAAYQPHDAPAESMVTSPALTRAGVILGTVAYMAPEQAEGRAADERSDVFSLGVTFYELLTGTRPFTGDSSLSVMSSILRDTPRPLTDVNPALPPALGRIVRRCLEKDPDRRYHSARDLRNDLEEVTSADSIREDATAVSRTTRSRPIGWTAAMLAGAAAVGFALALALYGLRSDPAGPPAMTFSQVSWAAGVEAFPSLSPDGRWIVYTGDGGGNADIYLQALGGQTTINLTADSPADDRQPAFSPDGERIAFRSEREGGGIFVMGRTGEATRRVADRGFNPAWSPDGRQLVVASGDITFQPHSRGPQSALWIVSVDTGEIRELTAGDAVQPQWSPNGHRIAFWTARGPARQRDIATMPVAGGDPVLVTDDAHMDWNPVWSPDGRYLYFLSDRGGIMSAWRIAIDEASGRTNGSPEPVVLPASFAAHLAMSAGGGRLAFASVQSELNVDRLDLDAAAGAFTGPPVSVTTGSRFWSEARESPDGQWLVLVSDTPTQDLFVMRSDGTGLRQLTNDAALDRRPSWSADSRRVAFQSNRGGSWEAWAINLDGSGLAALTENLLAHSPVWSRDGTRLAFSDFLREFRPGLIDPRRPVAGQTVERLPPASGSRYWVAFDWSPDGRWLAGARDTGGVVVYSFDSGEVTPITDAGFSPFWLPDNRRLVFHTGTAIAIVDRETTQSAVVQPATGAAILHVSRDGRRVYVARSALRADVWVAEIQ